MAGHFFTVSVPVLEAIASQTKSVDAVLGYLVLRMSAQKGTVMCTGGAPSMERHLGITRHKADQILKALRAVRLGEGPADYAVVTPEVWNQATGDNMPSKIGRYPAKVLPSYGEEEVALPNTLVKGLPDYEDGSPVRQLREIEPKNDRLDAVRLLLRLYQQHSLLDYGGVDPKEIYRAWCDQGPLAAVYQEHFDSQVTLGYLGRDVAGGDGLHYWLVQPGEYQARSSLVQDIGGSTERFWRIYDQLQKLNLFYEVAVVFDDDPLQNLSAEPCYSLYIFDQWAREEEAAQGLDKLAIKIQDHAASTGFLRRKGLEALQPAVYSGNKETGSGLFLVTAWEETARVVTVIRLRFRPHTEDIGAGIERERENVGHWKNLLTRPVVPMVV